MSIIFCKSKILKFLLIDIWVKMRELNLNSKGLKKNKDLKSLLRMIRESELWKIWWMVPWKSKRKIFWLNLWPEKIGWISHWKKWLMMKRLDSENMKSKNRSRMKKKRRLEKISKMSWKNLEVRFKKFALNSMKSLVFSWNANWNLTKECQSNNCKSSNWLPQSWIKKTAKFKIRIYKILFKIMRKILTNKEILERNYPN